MRNLAKSVCVLGLFVSLFGLNGSAEAIDFQIASFIEEKVEESIASPARRMKAKASDKIENIRSKFSRNKTYSSRTYTHSSRNTASSTPKQTTNSVYLSNETAKPKPVAIEPEVSGVQSSRQFEAQIDEMVLANWKRPPSVSVSDWNQILVSTKSISKRTGIPQQLIMSLINKESGFNHEAVSRSGARGLTQLMPTTAKYECGLSKYELFDIDKNIKCGIGYLNKQMDYFQQLDLAVAAYNAGPGAVRRAVQKSGSKDINRVTALLKPETAPYVRKILASINYQSDFI